MGVKTEGDACAGGGCLRWRGGVLMVEEMVESTGWVVDLGGKGFCVGDANEGAQRAVSIGSR